MHETFTTEWCRLLDDAVSWLPRPIRDEIEQEADSSQWSDPVEASSFLKIILCIKEADLSMAMSLIERVYETSEYAGALFLLRARVHFLQGEYEDMMSCLKHAADLNEDPAQVEQTTAELAALLNRVTGQRDGLESDIELNTECLPEQIDEGRIQIDPTSDKGSCLRLSVRDASDYLVSEQVTENATNDKITGEPLCMDKGRLQSNASKRLANCWLDGKENVFVPDHYWVRKIIVPIVRAFELPIQTSSPTSKSLCAGLHVLSRDQLSALPSGLTVINLEQLLQFQGSDYLNFLKRAQVIDYSLANLSESQIEGSVCKIFPRFWDHTCVFENKHEQTTDILFVGSLNERRRQFIEYFRSTGLKIKTICDVFEKDLYDEINKSKIFINIHFHEAKVLEVFRLAQTYQTSAVWVSEITPNTKIEGYEFLIDPFAMAPNAPQLANLMNLLLKNDKIRTQLKNRQEKIFSQWRNGFEHEKKMLQQDKKIENPNLTFSCYKEFQKEALLKKYEIPDELIRVHSDLSKEGWLESRNWVENYLSESKYFRKNELFGTLSWKALHKMQSNLGFFVKNIEEAHNEGFDALIFNPSPALSCVSISGFHHAEAVGHAGIIEFAQSIERLGFCPNKLYPSKFWSPANLLVANSDFWARFIMEITSTILLPMSGLSEGENYSYLNTNGGYLRAPQLTMRPFFIERSCQIIFDKLDKDYRIKVCYPAARSLKARYKHHYRDYLRLFSGRAALDKSGLGISEFIEFINGFDRKVLAELCIVDDRPIWGN